MAPALTGLGLPTLVIDKSAGSVLVTVVDVLAVLLPGLGSGSLAVTLAVLLSVPASVGVTTIVTLALLSNARFPRLQATVPLACAQVPWVDVAETNLTPAGNVSVSVTPVAAEGPLFVTVMA